MRKIITKKWVYALHPQNFRQVRKGRKISIAEVADRSGLTLSYISDVEREKKPINELNSLRLANALESLIGKKS